MNMANKITMSRIFLSVIILIILLFPWSQFNIDFGTDTVSGIVIEYKYIVAGVLFIIASITDFIDGHVARKYNMVTDFGKMIDAISDKILTNTLVVVLACAERVNPIIAVIIIGRDIIVDSIKMLVGNKGKAVAAIGIAKFKTASLMFGLTLKLFYDLPFSLFIDSDGVSDLLLIVAAILSILSGAKYYIMAREYITEK
jgi:CDP-diacylglycerol--glycerol-3-phosphate 3-phosphatidyltransferase